MAKGKITEITFVKEWEAPDGTKYFYHLIEIENGDNGKAPFRSKNQYQLGDLIEYTISGDRIQITKQIATEKPKSKHNAPMQNKAPRTYSQSGKRNKEDYLGFVYGYAKDIHIATMTITGKKVPLSELKKNVEEMYAHIDQLLNMTEDEH